MIYLLHFDRPICPSRPTQHYLGWCPDDGIDDRLWAHRQGKGARLTAVAKEKGIRFTLAELIPGDRTKERQLKQLRNYPRFCPICQKMKLKPIAIYCLIIDKYLYWNAQKENYSLLAIRPGRLIQLDGNLPTVRKGNCYED
jgi:predicted GIY-YIG superfamily endonuclease